MGIAESFYADYKPDTFNPLPLICVLMYLLSGLETAQPIEIEMTQYPPIPTTNKLDTTLISVRNTTYLSQQKSPNKTQPELYQTSGIQRVMTVTKKENRQKVKMKDLMSND